MYTKDELISHLKKSNTNPKGTIMVHSSMRAIGQVDGGADTVIDALCNFMDEGLLLFPTHSWDEGNLKEDTYNVATEKSCVGLLTNIFLSREDVVRSLHPTHSVAAYGKRKVEYTNKDKVLIQKGEPLTPCPRHGCFGSLYDEPSQLLFVGTNLTSNTYIHSIEEWLDVPNRLLNSSRPLKVIDYDKTSYDVTYIGHNTVDGSVSENYGRIEQMLYDQDIATTFTFGDATCMLVEVKAMTELIMKLLEKDPDYFGFR